MVNLQIIDSVDGGYFAFDRNDYTIDNGIYTELYATLFGTNSEFWGDSAFGIQISKITSRTGSALKNNASINQNSINQIKKAVNDDLKRFLQKNQNIVLKAVEVAHWSKTILIIIELGGYNTPFNFIYQATKESLENAKFKTY